jgi:hypothetical protein
MAYCISIFEFSYYVVRVANTISNTDTHTHTQKKIFF